MGEVAAVLMALIKEATAVIEARSWTAGIVREHEERVLVGLGANPCSQHAELGNDAARIFQRIF